MEHLFTLMTALILFSTSARADDTIRDKNNRARQIPAAPFTCGEPDEEAPEGLLKVRRVLKSQMAAAPFVWGNPDDAINVKIDTRLIVSIPPAPFFDGHADDAMSPELTLALGTSIAK